MLKGWGESELKIAKERNVVVYAGPLAGYDTAYLLIDKETKLLATGMRDQLNYELAAEDYAEGKWAHIGQFLTDALGHQFEAFRLWVTSAMNPNLYCDRILVLTGDHEAAQTLQRIITYLTGNREANAETYLTGGNKHYNVHLIGSEHLTYDGPIRLKVSRMLTRFLSPRRNVHVPGGKVSFVLPKLWQRLSIITDERSLMRLKDSANKYIVLKLNPAKLTATQLEQEIDYLGLAIASDVDEEQIEQTPAYWYQDATPAKLNGWDLLEAIGALPGDWKGTAGDFVEATMCPISARVIGRRLTSLANDKKILTSRVLDGKVLYRRIGN
jgi:hypothetical protein